MRGTTIEHLSLISSGPVKSFWYCMDCDAVTNQPQCAYCASTTVHPLQDLINRQSRSLIHMQKPTEALYNFIEAQELERAREEVAHG